MESKLFNDRVIEFYKKIKKNLDLPKNIEVLNPFDDKEVKYSIKMFYNKYYSDSKERILILGINPGRFGAGVTGIPFTDPVNLEVDCLIANNFEKRKELSSDFVYQMIHAFGGAEKFYNKYFIGAVSPLGFVKDEKNFNYYDSTELQDSLEDFIVESIHMQINIGCSTKICYCLGQGKNYKYLQKLNKRHAFFQQIIPLAHPRYIMQYKRKLVSHYIDEYLRILT